MNDRYLYRAKRANWRALPKEMWWVEGYLFDDGFENGRMFVGGLVIEEYHGTASDDWSITGIDFYEVDQSTICQCTGLKDKNGKLIFENDIIKHYNDTSHPDKYDKGIVRWNDFNIRFERYSTDMKGNVCMDRDCVYEAIGNIFDNPELLEVAE